MESFDWYSWPTADWNQEQRRGIMHPCPVWHSNPTPRSAAATTLSVPLIPGYRPELAELLLGTPNFWRSSRLAPLTADRNFRQNQVKTKDRACGTQQKSHFHQPLSQCVVFSQAVTPRVKGTLCDRAEADMGPSVTMHSTPPHANHTDGSQVLLPHTSPTKGSRLPKAFCSRPQTHQQATKGVPTC